MAPPPVGSEIFGAAKGEDSDCDPLAFLEVVSLALAVPRAVAASETAESLELPVFVFVEDGSVGIIT
jgi:hypothetical protein